MDKRLFDAARTGDVVALRALLDEDPLILDKICLAEFAETPLHVAALAGKTEFAEEIMRLMPCFAMELNKDGFAPLHLASARGHVEMVMELLKHDNDYSLCFQKDKTGRIPLHYAVARGRILVIEKLISHCSESLQQVTAVGETVLHLAVKNFQFEALTVVLEKLKGLECFEKLLKTKDCQGEGKTIIELAEAKKQVQVLEVLKEYQNAQTDNVALAQSSGNDEIIELAAHNQEDQIDILNSDPEADSKQNEKQESKKERKLNPGEDNILLVTAVLVATVTYEALVTPPSSIWEKGINLNTRCIFKTSHEKNYSLQKRKQDCPARLFYLFLIFNTACFFSSVILIMIVTARYDSTRLRQINSSIVLLLVNYLLLIVGLSPDAPTVYIFYVPVLLITVFAQSLILREEITKFKQRFLEFLANICS